MWRLVRIGGLGQRGIEAEEAVVASEDEGEVEAGIEEGEAMFGEVEIPDVCTYMYVWEC